MARIESKTASIGLRAKTGRAIAVALTGLSNSPRVIKRVEFSVVDSASPGTFQPYHEFLDLPWEQAQVGAQKLARKIERIAAKELRSLVRELASEGYSVCGRGRRKRTPHRRFDERSLDQTVESELKLPIAKITAQLAEMGREAGAPWRADEKAAATAAWLVLARLGWK